jgi:Domain of unknown function (DUF4340)
MSRRRFIVLLIAALAAICGALYLSSQRNLTRDTRGVLLLPTLAPQLNTVTELGIRKGGPTPTVTLHRVGEQWAIAQRADYPADVAKLRKLLLAMSEAKIEEEKTSNPANFSIIGVEDPAQAGASGAEITVVAHDGKHAVIVGKPVGEGNFARRAGENTSYIVAPAISVEAEPRSWIDSRLIDVPSASIQSVEVKLPTAAGYVLRRLKPNEEGFALEGTPAGRKPLDSKALAPSTTTLSGLTAEDVAAATDIDFSKPTEAVITLSDGNVITLTGTQIADKRWIEIKATKDAALAAKTQNRAFEVASYRYDAIFRPLDQLLVPKESKIPGKPAASIHKPSAAAAVPKSAPAPKPAPAPTP